MNCQRCDKKLDKHNERKVVIDVTWWPQKYKTIRYSVCDKCWDKMHDLLSPDEYLTGDS